MSAAVIIDLFAVLITEAQTFTKGEDKVHQRQTRRDFSSTTTNPSHFLLVAQLPPPICGIVAAEVC